MKNTIAKRLISIFIGLLLLAYIGYQIYNANYSQVQTETAISAKTSDSVPTNGFIIRRETLLKQTSAGVVAYTVADGGKVSNGGTVASVYSSAQDAVNQTKREQLNNQLETLQELNQMGAQNMANPDNLNKQIHQKIYDMLWYVNENKQADLSAEREDILYLLNEWQIVTGKVSSFDARISSLNTQIASLSSSNAIGTITTPVSGYFIAKTDGYENTYPFAASEEKRKQIAPLLQLTADDLKAEKKPEAVASDVIGKVCENFDWYVACVVPPETALRLKEGNRITISMPFATSEEIPATIRAVNQKDKESEAAVILECSYMNQDLADVRNETIKLNVETYEGIRVSQKSVHFETITKETTDEEGNVTKTTREVKGVYILHGSEINFVEIVPLYSNNDYVICKDMSSKDVTDEEREALMTDASLSMYDEVVIGGTDLYDGKIVK